ncbi:Neutral alpha-glucosidase AB [Tritrichomonas foetus]|uniref:Glucosidase II subunit alpha n=1 Tax=Tritrichomonas foetus TaxID=1144522 RepID=A0A1J4KGL7_9EUKA|nr:Neutral alpha-glucosidase AB [Tritrichomonas foetus]|eukprot:OHT10080.1 Neutral alpha-glucosidase AB [Tritrichomonas foetus]
MKLFEHFCVKMIFFLFSFSLSVEQHRYCMCKQSSFCERNRFKMTPSKWKLDEKSNSITKNVFSSYINDKDLMLSIENFNNDAVKVKIEPGKKEAFRFDASTLLHPQKNSEIKQTSNSTHTTLTFENKDISLIISHSPFSIEYLGKNGAKIILNDRDSSIFEHHLYGKYLKNKNENENENENKEESRHNLKRNSRRNSQTSLRNGDTSVALDFTFDNDVFMGLPGHTLPLILPDTTDGEPIRLFNTDINSFEVNSRMSMYGAVPFLMSKDSAVFWNNPSETWIDIQKKKKNVRFLSEGGFIEIYLFSGTFYEMMDSFSSLTGKPQLPPLFALGLHQCRWGYTSQEMIESVNHQLDAKKVPHDVLWFDLDHTDDRKYFVWDKRNYPEPLKLLDSLAIDKRQLVVLVDPHLKAQDSYYVYKEASSHNYLIRDSQKNQYIGHCWPGSSAWPDFLHPKVNDWWASQFSYKNFIDSRPNLHIWNDMNEISVFDIFDATAPRDLLHYNDIEEREVHNIYGHLMVKSTYQGLVERNEDKNQRPFILTRSYYAGSQQYAFVWTGDNDSDMKHFENSIQMLLSYSVGGMVYSGSDVGGFFNSPSDTILSHWYQVGAWCYPFFRVHCHHLAKFRELYTLSDDNFKKAIEAVRERYRLLPYWYTLSRKANLTGEPLVKPVFWDFKDYNEALDDIILLGHEFIISPFSKKINLPTECKWYNYATLEESNGKDQTKDSDVAVFLKGGSIIPFKQRIRKSANLMYYDPFSFLIALDEKEEAQGTVYIDDGVTFDYQKGLYIYKSFHYKDGKIWASDCSELNDKNEKEQYYDDYNVKIEQIKIIGIKTSPKKIICKSNGNEIELKFDITSNDKRNVLIIHRVSVLIADNWEIVCSF